MAQELLETPIYDQLVEERGDALNLVRKAADDTRAVERDVSRMHNSSGSRNGWFT